MRRYPIPREPRPPSGAYNSRGWEKSAIFHLYRRSISETVRDRPMVTTVYMERYRQSWVPDWIMLFSMTLSDLWPRFQGHDIFRHWITQKRHEIKPYSYYRTSIGSKSYALYRMVTFPMTVMDPGFKVTAFLKSNISKTVHFRDKVTKEH